MKNLIQFLDKNSEQLKMKFGDFTIESTSLMFRKNNHNKYIITACIGCLKEHIQFLKDMGVQFDFSNKRVGMQQNQNSIKGTGNNLNINATMTFSTFYLVHKFFRGNSALMHNNHWLKSMGFHVPATKVIENPKRSEVQIATAATIRRKLHNSELSNNDKTLPFVKNRFSSTNLLY